MPDAFARGRLGGFSFQAVAHLQGGLTLGPERGELAADFWSLGSSVWCQNILIHYFGSTKYVASPVLSHLINSRPKARCIRRNLACTLCISGRVLL